MDVFNIKFVYSYSAFSHVTEVKRDITAMKVYYNNNYRLKGKFLMFIVKY